MKAGRVSIAVLCVLACVATPSMAFEVLGKKPSHVWGGPSSIPNSQAVTAAIWAPGIDEGFVPQGLTFAEGEVLVSAYQSSDPKVGKGPCRAWAVNPQSGAVRGSFDLPEDCGHAGGLAYLGNGVLIASDTRRLYKIDLAVALADGNTQRALLSSIKLAGELKGSLLDVQGDRIFIASSETSADKAKGFFLPLSVFDTHKDKTIREDVALLSFPVGTEAQGAAFDAQNRLWMTFSNSKYGVLRQLDGESGKVLAEHEMVIGIEDIAFDPAGRVWSVSEAGTLRWSKWRATFPVIFALDPTKIK